MSSKLFCTIKYLRCERDSYGISKGAVKKVPRKKSTREKNLLRLGDGSLGSP